MLGSLRLSLVVCALAIVLSMFPALAADKSSTPAMPAASGKTADYVLGVGDKLRITTFGEDDLSGEFQVSSTGMISMPLIGEVKAAGMTISQVQGTITSKLSDGYMKSPHVSLEVL